MGRINKRSHCTGCVACECGSVFTLALHMKIFFDAASLFEPQSLNRIDFILNFERYASLHFRDAKTNDNPILSEVKIMIGKFNIMNSMNRYNTKCREIHVWLVKYRLYWNCLRCLRCSILEFWNAYEAIVRYYAENIVRMKGLQERALKTIFSKAEFSTLLLVWNKSHEIFIPYHFVWEKKSIKIFASFHFWHDSHMKRRKKIVRNWISLAFFASIKLLFNEGKVIKASFFSGWKLTHSISYVEWRNI